MSLKHISTLLQNLIETRPFTAADIVQLKLALDHITIVLAKPKRCSCGMEYTAPPPDARFLADDELAGYYWECKCGSTLFIAS